MIYIHANWKDSRHLYDGNQPASFVLELPKPLTGHWEVALADAKYKPKKASIFLFCDSCEESCVGGKLMPLLRRIDDCQSYANQYFIKVHGGDELRRLKLYLLSGDLKPVELTDFMCTLCLKKSGRSISKP